MGSSMVALPLLLPGVERVAPYGSRLSEGSFLLGLDLFGAWDDGVAADCRMPDDHAMGECERTREVQYSFDRNQDMVNSFGAPSLDSVNKDDSIYPGCGIERGRAPAARVRVRVRVCLLPGWSRAYCAAAPPKP
jgi:hypothetical protein